MPAFTFKFFMAAIKALISSSSDISDLDGPTSSFFLSVLSFIFQLSVITFLEIQLAPSNIDMVVQIVFLKKVVLFTANKTDT